MLSLIVVIIITVSACISASAPYRGAGGKAAEASAKETELTLIIDAGHGGADGGAVSLSGVKESEINLELALKLDQIMAFFGVHTVMTRTTEELDYSAKADSIREKKAEDQNNRIHLINGTANAVLISIHQNNFPDGRPFGAQVLYAPTSGSKEFAEYMQSSLITALNEQNRRSAAKVPGSILLLNHIKCPAIIIECGFLSNADEESLLRTEAYQLKVAAVIAAGFLANQSSLNTLYSGGMNEG